MRYAVAAALVIAGALIATVVITLQGGADSNPDVEPPIADAAPLATIVDASGALTVNDEPAAPGEDFAGYVTLDEGTAELRLRSGTGVRLAGATRLGVDDPMRVTMARGRAAFDCPPGVVGFTVVTPRGVEIVDLGTRFDVAVLDGGATRVRVDEGKVEVRWRGRSQLLAAGQGIEIHGADAPRYERELIATEFDAGEPLHPMLEDAAGTWRFDGGVAQNTGRRGYIRTRRTDFSAVDFTAELTVHLPDAPTGPQIAFVGIGGGEPDASEWDNPIPGLYLETPPMRIEADAGADADDFVVAPIDAPAGGSHRVRIEKYGDDVTFAIDLDYSGGPFVADRAQTIDLRAAAPFLNPTNARLFFGTQDAPVRTTFDDLTIRTWSADAPTATD